MDQQKQSGMMAEVFERGKLVWRLMNDQRVPTWLKVGIPSFVFLYFVSPIDLIPDFILGLGQLDDIGVILLGMAIMIRLAPKAVVDEHKRALGMDADIPPGGSSGEPTRRVYRDSAPIEGEYTVKAERDARQNGYKE